MKTSTMNDMYSACVVVHTVMIDLLLQLTRSIMASKVLYWMTVIMILVVTMVATMTMVTKQMIMSVHQMTVIMMMMYPIVMMMMNCHQLLTI